MRITSRQLKRIIRETLEQMSDPIESASQSVQSLYSSDIEELDYKMNELEEQLPRAVREDGTVDMNMLDRRHARELAMNIAEALGYVQQSYDEDVMCPARLIQAVHAAIRGDMPPSEEVHMWRL